MINLKQSVVNKAPDIIKSSVWFLSTNLLNPSHSFFQRKLLLCVTFLLSVVQISFYFIISLSLIFVFLFLRVVLISFTQEDLIGVGDVDVKMCIIGYM